MWEWESRLTGGASGYAEWAPPAAWRDVVACVWEQRATTPTTQRVIPDAHADLIAYNDGRITVVGLHDRAELPDLSAGTHVRGIRLHPHAVGSAFRLDAAALLNQTVALEDILGTRQARRLAQPNQLAEWIESLAPSPRSRHAVTLLRTYTVDHTAERVGISSRQLHRSLVSETGMSPKKLQRVFRMQRFLAAAENGQSLAAAAADAGYFDQPHLTRDLTALTGVSPAQLLRERNASEA